MKGLEKEVRGTSVDSSLQDFAEAALTMHRAGGHTRESQPIVI